MQSFVCKLWWQPLRHMQMVLTAAVLHCTLPRRHCYRHPTWCHLTLHFTSQALLPPPDVDVKYNPETGRPEYLDDDDDDDNASLLTRCPLDMTPLLDAMQASQGCQLLLVLKEYLKEVYGLTDGWADPCCLISDEMLLVQHWCSQELFSWIIIEKLCSVAMMVLFGVVCVSSALFYCTVFIQYIR